MYDLLIISMDNTNLENKSNNTQTNTSKRVDENMNKTEPPDKKMLEEYDNNLEELRNIYRAWKKTFVDITDAHDNIGKIMENTGWENVDRPDQIKLQEALINSTLAYHDNIKSMMHPAQHEIIYNLTGINIKKHFPSEPDYECPRYQYMNYDYKEMHGRQLYYDLNDIYRELTFLRDIIYPMQTLNPESLISNTVVMQRYYSLLWGTRVKIDRAMNLIRYINNMGIAADLCGACFKIQPPRLYFTGLVEILDPDSKDGKPLVDVYSIHIPKDIYEEEDMVRFISQFEIPQIIYPQAMVPYTVDTYYKSSLPNQIGDGVTPADKSDLDESSGEDTLIIFDPNIIILPTPVIVYNEIYRLIQEEAGQCLNVMYSLLNNNHNNPSDFQLLKCIQLNLYDIKQKIYILIQDELKNCDNVDRLFINFTSDPPIDKNGLPINLSNIVEWNYIEKNKKETDLISAIDNMKLEDCFFDEREIGHFNTNESNEQYGAVGGSYSGNTSTPHPPTFIIGNDSMEKCITTGKYILRELKDRINNPNNKPIKILVISPSPCDLNIHSEDTTLINIFRRKTINVHIEYTTYTYMKIKKDEYDIIIHKDINLTEEGCINERQSSFGVSSSRLLSTPILEILYVVVSRPNSWHIFESDSHVSVNYPQYKHPSEIIQALLNYYLLLTCNGMKNPTIVYAVDKCCSCRINIPMESESTIYSGPIRHSLSVLHIQYNSASVCFSCYANTGHPVPNFYNLFCEHKINADKYIVTKVL